MSLKSLKNQTLRNKSTINSVNLTGGASIGPVITSIIVTDASYNNLDDTAIVPAGGYAKLIGSGFASGCSAYFNGSSVTTTFVSATEVRVVIPATTAGTYNIMLFNPSTAGAIYLNLGISSAPTFTTTAGSLGTTYETTAVSTSIAATGDAPITYALYSGSLPTGVTLASNGTLSGTSPVEASSTTYSFVVQATDAQLQDTTRSFSLTISSDIVSWSTPAADYAHVLVGNSVMSNVSLSAASAAGYNITYAANTLPTGVSLSGNTIFGTPTVEQTVYTALTATAATTGRSDTRYVSWSVSLGDTSWKYLSLLLNGALPASTFIADSSNNNLSLTLNGDTRPSNFNPYSASYYSNFFDGTGDYISVPDSTAFTMGAGNFTLECWVNLSSVAQQIFIGTCNAAGSQGSMSFVLGLNGSSYPQIGVGYAGSMYVSTFGTVLTTNRWYHIAGVRNGAMVNVYVDGVKGPDLNMGVLAITDSTETVAIGRNGAGNFEYVTGYISNARIVKGTAVYTGAFTPPTAPLTAIANTSLLTCQSNRLIDNSLNNFVVTKGGDTTVSGFTPFTPPTSVTVNNLYSTYFDGTGDYLNPPNNAVLAVGAGEFTIECWVYFTNSVGNNGVFQLSSSYFPSAAAGLAIYVSGALGWGAYYNGTASNAAPIPATNTWYHVAISRSGTTTKVYINGVSIISVTDTTNYTGTFLTVGGYFSTAYLMAGYISNFRIVKGTAVYTANFTPPTAPLTAITNTSLLTCQDATIKDNSTNAFAITSNGQAQPVAQSPFTQTTTAVTTTYLGSGYFDGTGDYLSIPASGALILNGDFTIECWTYTSTLSGNQGIIASSGQRFGLIRQTSNFYWLGSTDLSGSSIPILANVWNHVAVSRSGSTFRLFVNGIQANSGTYSEASTSNIWFIGSNQSGEQYNGYIADARVIKGTALYTANFAPPAQPLTAVTNTQLLTLQTDHPASNKQFIDNSTNNFPITQVGNTSQGTFSPYGANWSNYFDGTGDYLSAASNAAFALPGNFTYECWFNSDNAGTTSQWVEVPVNNGLQIYYSGTQIFVSAYAVSALITYTYTMPVATWTHMAVVRNGTGSNNLVLYINGVSVATATTNVSFAQGAFRVGGASYIFKGYISNARLVKGTAVYTANFTPSTTPLTAIANTSLLTCQDNRFVDDSPNNFTITRNGDVSVQRFSPFSPVIQTPTTYSTFFDGVWVNVNSGDYLTLNGQSNFAFGSNNFTVEMWVYATSFSANVVLYDSRPGNTSGVYGILYYDTAGIVNWNVNALTIAGTAITLNTWNHLAVSRSSTTTKLFINGTQVGTATDTNSYLNGALAPTIGSNGYSRGSNSMQGYLSNVRVVNGTAVYTANFTPSTTPLTAITNTVLLTCQSPTFIDNSINAFAITAVNEPKLSAYNPFGFTNNTGQDYTPALYGGSAYFDGTGDYLTTPSNAAITQFGTGDFTVECWAYTTSNPHAVGMYLFDVRTSGSTGNWALFFASGNGLTFFYNGASLATTAATFSTSTWYHIAYSRKSTSGKLFVNGVSVASVTDSNNYSLTTVGTIGSRYTIEALLQGYISDARIVKGTALYTGNFVPPLAPLTAIPGTTLLLNMDKAGISDKSRSVNLETLGDAKIVYENPYNGSYYSNFFDGTGDYLTVPSNAGYAFGTGDFTVECWVYINVATSYSTLIDATGNAGAGNSGGWFLEYSATRGLSVYLGGGAANVQYATTPALGVWTHIAVTRSSSTMRFFINGVLNTTGTYTNNITQSSTVYIGAAGGNQFLLNGYLSNVRIVKGTAVYTANFTPSTTPLTAIANTTLLTCQSNKFIDNSLTAATLTRNGDVAVRSINPFQRNTGSSMFFDGTGDYLVSPSSAGNSLGTDFTVEAWVLPTAASGTYGLTVAGTYDGITNSGWSVIVNRSTGGPLGLAFIHGNALQSTYGTYLTVGAWTHIAVSRSGSSLRLFVNGVVVTTTTYATTDSIVSPLYVGSQGAGATLFTGYIADLRITKSARYTTTFTPPTSQFLTR